MSVIHKKSDGSINLSLKLIRYIIIIVLYKTLLQKMLGFTCVRKDQLSFFKCS